MTREEAIFAEVLGKCSEAEEAAYLDLACAGDPVLRRDVEALLVAHRSPRGILEAPPAQPDLTSLMSASNHGVGGSVGPYKLLEQIGGGGMGVVYMAEQSRPVRRMVALKIIKPGMDSSQVIARFEAERQALTMMDHPNIAKVLDAGTTDVGSPYFVMELVKGIPITDYCDQAQLNTRERLELFIPVCQAVQHAHQKGIIHRDLKPGNILVTLHDDNAVPKVIDFGIAKATGQVLTDKTLFTNFAQMMGTPLYMSPEQAQISGLDVDTRSDVYSLGVLLYELLTGTTPFVKQRLLEAAYDEMRRIIREEEPPKPSTRLSTLGDKLNALAADRKTDARKLGHLIRGELDWIVMKALEKDRARRYETSSAFAADILRYLSNQPVEAGPPSTLYRFRKFARRNKRSLATASILGVMLVAALGTIAGSIGWAARDRAARRSHLAAQVELILEEAQRFQQEQKWPEAMAAAERAQALATADDGSAKPLRLQTLLTDLKMVQRLEDIRLQRRELKPETVGGSRLGERFGVRAGEAIVDDPTDKEADEAYAALFRDNGIYVQGLTIEEVAQRIGAHPEIALALAAALDDWALCRKRHKNAAAASVLTMVAQVSDPDPVRRRVRTALLEHDGKTLTKIANSDQSLGLPPATLLMLALNLPPENRSSARLELLLRAQQQYSDDFWINLDLAATLRAQEPARLDEAISFYRAALAIRPQSAACRINLGMCLRAQGKLDEAILCYRKEIQLRPNDAIAYNNLGTTLSDQGKLAEAETEYRQAIRLKPDFTLAHANLAIMLDRQGKPREAEPEYRLVIRLDPTDAGAHIDLGAFYHDQGRLREAETEAREAIRLNPKSAEAHTNLGIYLLDQSRLVEAEPEVRLAIRLDPNGALGYMSLARYLFSCGKFEETEATSRQAMAILERQVASFPTIRQHRINLGACYCNIARDLCVGDKWAAGLEYYAKSIVVLEAVLTQDANISDAREYLRQALGWRSVALMQLSRYTEAIKDYDRLLVLYSALKPPGIMPDGTDTAYVRLLRAVAVAHTGDYLHAVAVLDELMGDQSRNSHDYYNAACGYAVASRAVMDDEPLKKRYETQAVALLFRAQAAGYFKDREDLVHVNEDTDFEPLRVREDFKKFLASVTRQVEEKVRQQSREAATRKSPTTTTAK